MLLPVRLFGELYLALGRGIPDAVPALIFDAQQNRLTAYCRRLPGNCAGRF
jgi:hypothetical protein